MRQKCPRCGGKYTSLDYDLAYCVLCNLRLCMDYNNVRCFMFLGEILICWHENGKTKINNVLCNVKLPYDISLNRLLKLMTLI